MNPNGMYALTQLVAAVRELFHLDHLAYAAPGEPNVVAELFALLRPRFPDCAVANEYDRREQEVKRLGTSRIIPDLIVHHVGNQKNNLLVVDVKLVGNYNFYGDVRKLRGMTDPAGAYRYTVGVHLVLSMPHRRVNRGHVYIDGEFDPNLTTWFEVQFN